MKSLSNNRPIERLPIPKELVISMSQHLGAPATAVKAVGDHVSKGEKIGTASSFISADVHSPVDGTVTAIKKVTMANSVVCDALVITPDEQQSEPFAEKRDYSEFTKEQILAEIKDKGIVGMGGATFPAHVKMTIAPGKSVQALVINGVECEPYLTADHRLMLERTEQVLEGIMICRKALSPERTIIGIEANKPDAIEKLSKAVAEKGLPIEVMPLKMKYPQGDEKQLLKATINREIPSGKLPLDVGAVVMNLGTTHAVYEAVAYGKPLFERVMTITGDCISRPCNVIAPIGTKVRDLLDFAGGFSSEPDKLVSGGPMMGFAFYDEDTPVAKGTSGILAIADKKNYRQTHCLSCGRCVSACPMGLMPTKLYALISNGKYEEAMKNNLMDCKECGCCAFSCPAHLDLVHAFKTGKKMGRKK
ncbi:MAG: electron transport complex subunit RsxC [Spirochaetales bacterium]|nr:electron transport complex subunit RsxC [Spirochaetales bacterium]